MKNIAYLLGLHTVLGLGPGRLKKLLDYFSDPKTAWKANKREFVNIGIPGRVIENIISTRNSLDPEAYYQEIINNSIKVVTFFDKEYPKNLKEIFDPPIILYYKGNLLPEDNFGIGIVGSRKMTTYGKFVTEKFSKELSFENITVVSGLARGVDTVAHKFAIEAGGRTVAVLGGGLNKIFPPENTQLVEKISSGFGAVITEFPPDYPHLAGNFPARNRIISGISLGVLVTEAAEDSGSLITARLAAEQGKEVFAVPGPITSSLSNGTALLIKEGAKVVTCIDDILEEIQPNKSKLLKIKTDSYNTLTDLEKSIIEHLNEGSLHIDEICRKMGSSINEISGLLIKLEIQGYVANMGGGEYSKS